MILGKAFTYVSFVYPNYDSLVSSGLLLLIMSKSAYINHYHKGLVFKAQAMRLIPNTASLLTVIIWPCGLPNNVFLNCYLRNIISSCSENYFPFMVLIYLMTYYFQLAVYTSAYPLHYKEALAFCTILLSLSIKV